jgi:hypothetical protein
MSRQVRHGVGFTPAQQSLDRIFSGLRATDLSRVSLGALTWQTTGAMLNDSVTRANEGGALSLLAGGWRDRYRALPDSERCPH